jgi:hypothetical protein
MVAGGMASSMDAVPLRGAGGGGEAERAGQERDLAPDQVAELVASLRAARLVINADLRNNS